MVVGLVAPESWFAWFRAEVVGTPHPFTEPFVLSMGQRLTAVVSAALGGFSLWRMLVRDPAPPPEALGRRWTQVASVTFAGTVLFNVRYAGVQLGVWRFWLPFLGHLYLPITAAFTTSALLALGPGPWRSLQPRAGWVSVGLGMAYGGFSGLWHCCAPLWESQGVFWPLAALIVPVWAVALAGFVTGVSLRLRSPAGEALAALLFAAGYPWHTLLWFAQGLVAGAFFVLLARRVGSALAPGLFIASAYLVHTTIPFLV